MPKLRPDDVPLTQEENASVRAGIASDPDTLEANDQWFSRAKPAIEVEPEFVERWRRSRTKANAT